MTHTLSIGISRCLLGEEVRFDGGHKRHYYITELLSQFCNIVGVCPEVESGLTVPRPTIHLRGDPKRPILVEVLNPDKDHTKRVQDYSKAKVQEFASLSGFILKSKSPTCGMERVKVYQEKPKPPKLGVGVFARELRRAYPELPMEEEGRLNDPVLRENFLERVFVYQRFQDTVKKNPSKKALISFHSEHKLTLLAHHQETYRALGKELSNLKEKDDEPFLSHYFSIFMGAMEKRANRRTHTNVLMHVQGYFKDKLDADDKAELTEAIERYRLGQTPLIVPITLLKHHLRHHPDPYLQTQRYLFPYPEELMLRNHI
jgi:uncharacterized protein YbgA (DUF1722 family)/uncharacterized protein YbbK (DUF523 family)